MFFLTTTAINNLHSAIPTIPTNTPSNQVLNYYSI